MPNAPLLVCSRTSRHSAECARLNCLDAPLSFSCVSLTVFPSDFFLQVCPSFRKKRFSFRLNKNKLPPALKKTTRWAEALSDWALPWELCWTELYAQTDKS